VDAAADRPDGPTGPDEGRPPDGHDAADTTDAFAHDAVLTFTYPDEHRARLVERSVRVEVGEIDDDRSAATVDRDGDDVSVRVRAADLVALRAGLNSWRRLVGVAEDVVDRAYGRDATGATDSAD
jgi:KEOPS complex subunit Pcc1